MDASFEALVFVECRHTSSACTEVAVVVGAVEDIGYTGGLRYCSKKACHFFLCYVRCAQVMSLCEVVSAYRSRVASRGVLRMLSPTAKTV